MTEQTSEERTTTATIAEELGKLGKQLGDAFRAAWESEERQGLQRELGEGLSALGDQLEDAVQSARKSEALTELKADLKNAADDARQAIPLEDIRSGLVRGIQKLNSELGELIEKWQTKPDVNASSGGQAGGKTA